MEGDTLDNFFFHLELLGDSLPERGQRLGVSDTDFVACAEALDVNVETRQIGLLEKVNFFGSLTFCTK